MSTDQQATSDRDLFEAAHRRIMAKRKKWARNFQPPKPASPKITGKPRQMFPEEETGCEDCGGRGWVVTETTARSCGCQDPRRSKRVLEARLRAAGMLEKEVRSALTPWDESVSPKPLWAKAWLDWIATGGELPPALQQLVEDQGRRAVEHPQAVLLLGPPGRGKTKTAAMLMRRWIQRQRRGALWCRAQKAFDRVQAERKADGHSSFEARMEAAGLFVLDEVGFEHRSDSGLMMDTIEEWMIRAHVRMTPLVITSNVERLNELGDARLASRLSGGFVITFDGADYRPRKSGGHS